MPDTLTVLFYSRYEEGSLKKQRLQQVFFPEGVRFDGKRLVGTGTTLPVFNYLNPISDEKKELVDQTGVEPVTS